MRIIRDLDPNRGGGDAPPVTHPAWDVAVAQALLRRASRGEIGPTLRIARPAGDVAAFGRTDTRRPGFARAVDACREAGFSPVVRAVGGRAAAYTGNTVLLDHIGTAAEPGRWMRRRFEEYGELLADVLAGLGVDARVGEVPGEFCPGAYSVNARGAVKLVGTAQRVVRGAWLFSAVCVVDDVDRIGGVLSQAYPDLGIAFDPATVGSVASEAPGVDTAAVAAAVAGAYEQHACMEPGALTDIEADEASAMLDDLVP